MSTNKNEEFLKTYKDYTFTYDADQNLCFVYYRGYLIRCMVGKMPDDFPEGAVKKLTDSIIFSARKRLETIEEVYQKNGRENCTMFHAEEEGLRVLCDEKLS